MNDAPKRYVNVDELMPQISLEQAAQYYGVTLQLDRTRSEIRTRCFFLHCPKRDETGDRALAIKGDSPATQWRCHQYGCGKGGNLVSACDLMKPGDSLDGRPRGERFKAIAHDLAAMVNGEPPPAVPARSSGSEATDKTGGAATEPSANVPLKDSDNERVRSLVNLDEKLISEVSQMSPPAAAYFRKRPFLTEDVLTEYRMGYMPRDAGSTLRGMEVFPLLNGDGDVLAWIGRNVSYEAQLSAWIAGGRQGTEPQKFRVPKNLHRGLEVFGQDRFLSEIEGRTDPGNAESDEAFRAAEFRNWFERLGVVVVEGANDRIRLWTMGVSSVALLSNTITKQQATKIAALAARHRDRLVTLLLDTDIEGETGARQVAWELLQTSCQVRLGWSRTLLKGTYVDRQPEDLAVHEWEGLVGAMKAELRST